MDERIKLYSDEYSQVLLTTDDRAAAHQFFLGSGQDSMPLVIDFGNGWKTRWVGRLELRENGGIAYVGASDYLKYILNGSDYRYSTEVDKGE
jgi:hypothetical protein